MFKRYPKQNVNGHASHFLSDRMKSGRLINFQTSYYQNYKEAG